MHRRVIIVDLRLGLGVVPVWDDGFGRCFPVSGGRFASSVRTCSRVGYREALECMMGMSVRPSTADTVNQTVVECADVPAEQSTLAVGEQFFGSAVKGTGGVDVQSQVDTVDMSSSESSVNSSYSPPHTQYTTSYSCVCSHSTSSSVTAQGVTYSSVPMGDECSVCYGDNNVRCGIDAKGRRETRVEMIAVNCSRMISRDASPQTVLPNVAHAPLANDDQRRDCKESPTLSLTDAQ